MAKEIKAKLILELLDRSMLCLVRAISRQEKFGSIEPPIRKETTHGRLCHARPHYQRSRNSGTLLSN